MALWGGIQGLVAPEPVELHYNWAVVQSEDMNGNIMGSARLFVTDREAECIHIKNGATKTLAIHFLHSCRHTLQPASSTTKRFFKCHFSLSGPESAKRQIHIKPKERCYYLNTANNQVIASTVSKRKALISRKKRLVILGWRQSFLTPPYHL